MDKGRVLDFLFLGMVAVILVLFGCAAVPAFGHKLWTLGKDFGSLIAGVLALVAGLYAYRAGLEQATATREQNTEIKRVRETERSANLTRCRALLTLPIADLMNYARTSLHLLNDAYAGFRGKEVIDDGYMYLIVTQLPPVPQDAIARIGETIAYADPEDATQMSEFLQRIQIQNSSVRDLLFDLGHPSPSKMLLAAQVDNYVRDTLEIWRWCESALLYGRFETNHLFAPSREDVLWLVDRLLADLEPAHSRFVERRRRQSASD